MSDFEFIPQIYDDLHYCLERLTEAKETIDGETDPVKIEDEIDATITDIEDNTNESHTYIVQVLADLNAITDFSDDEAVIDELSDVHSYALGKVIVEMGSPTMCSGFGGLVVKAITAQLTAAKGDLPTDKNAAAEKIVGALALGCADFAVSFIQKVIKIPVPVSQVLKDIIYDLVKTGLAATVKQTGHQGAMTTGVKTHQVYMGAFAKAFVDTVVGNFPIPITLDTNLLTNPIMSRIQSEISQIVYQGSATEKALQGFSAIWSIPGCEIGKFTTSTILPLIPF